MTVYIGPTFTCPDIIADRMGFRECQQVAHMTADTSIEMLTAAEDLGLPVAREMGARTVRWRYVVTALERNRLISHLGAQPITARQMFAIEAARAEAREEAAHARRH